MGLVGPAVLLCGIAFVIHCFWHDSKNRHREDAIRKLKRQEQARLDADYQRIHSKVREPRASHIDRVHQRARVVTPSKPKVHTPEGVIRTDPPTESVIDPNVI